MEKQQLEELKEKKKLLEEEMKTIRAKIKKESIASYSKNYAKNRYHSDDEYRKRQNNNAKARYYRLKEAKENVVIT